MTLNCNGKILDLHTKKIMGIINLSLDSFYDGGRYDSIDKVNARISNLVSNGAEIIDIGAVSSKPGSKLIDPKKELDIVSDYINELSNNFKDIHLSIDTYNSNVAEYALSKGFTLINDISAGKYDSNIFNVVKDYNAGYILMHMLGDPENMQENPEYDNVIESIQIFLKTKIQKLQESGFDNIIIDPGFGFGKSIDDNFKILKDLESFQSFKRPILVGLSRKSMIYKTLKITPEESLNGTTALNIIALEKGANILRVHDAKEAFQCINLLKKLN
tara:strand:- start:3868 stop:4689 length:822 start_codon:yes stop_codon:yes gene_type:complete